MELYIGGISQGKLLYVLQKYQIKKDSSLLCDGASCSKEDMLRKPYINHFHEFIRRLLQEQESKQRVTTDYVEEFLSEFLDRNPKAVVISNEVGYGIVPMNREDRIYRETVGRSLCKVAARSIRVERIVCGLGMVIKEAELA
jgi:adenosyl cobinamide kinase/adenosyl cobinamide phosphate guanylyltransferase